MVFSDLHLKSGIKLILIGALVLDYPSSVVLAQINNFWANGSMVISCSPPTFDSTAGSYGEGHVIGMIDVRKSCDFNKLGLWPDTGEVYPNKFYHQGGNSWMYSNLGLVFPLAVDQNGNIYAGGTSTYGSVSFPDGPFPNNQRGSGSIYKIDPSTGNVNTNFVNTRQANSYDPMFPNSMPNKTVETDLWGLNREYHAKSGPGLGDLAYNKYHHFLYASNFEDGKIYKIDPATGQILFVYDPSFGIGGIEGLDNGADGFAPRGQRPWALAINKEGVGIKLYYSNWKVDTRDTFPENNFYNEIWSVQLDLNGNPLPQTEKLEITLPHLTLNHPERPFHYSSNPVSDMAFSNSGTMYLSERAMDHEYGRWIGIVWDTATGGKLLPNPRNIANHARVLRYNQIGNSWNLHSGNDKFYELGHDVSSNRSVNSSGGVCVGDRSCPGSFIKDGMVYASGDFDDVTSDAFVYGVLGMENQNGNHTNHIYIDFDSFVARGGATTSPKTTPGDVEIWEGLPVTSLACDNHINVSMDTNCCVTITPEMVMQGNYPLNCLVVIVKDQNGRPIPGSPAVCNTYLGQTLQYELLDTCTKNRCWGTLLIEDKLGPQIECQEPDTVFCNNSGYQWPVPVITDNCGGPVKAIILSDETIKLPCDSFCIARRNVVYCYEDRFGNRSDTCVKTICFKKIPLSDIVWPRDTVFNCEDWDQTPPPSVSGVPMAGGYPLYPDWYLCQMAVTYEDQLIPVCPKSFKVIRTWTVIDWCKRSPENVYKHFQIIKVVDDRGPVVVCSPDMTVSTDIWSCTGSALIPPPRVIRECSDSVSIEVEYKIIGKDGLPTYEGIDKKNIKRLANGYFSITGLPLGLNWVIFHVTDQCGNKTECFTEVTVADLVPPVAVCDQKTIVSLTLDGTAKAEAHNFDDGSLDNCGIDRFEVKRMDDGLPCATPLGNTWGPYVHFCCADIGKTLMVSLRVWDEAGNSNICMVEVEVQDKIPPSLLCPPHITVSCEFDYLDIKEFGTVTDDISKQKAIIITDPKVQFSGLAKDGYAYDGCGVTVRELTTQYNLTCGKGTIVRTFEATDAGGLKSTCTQRISILDFDPDNVSVIWPGDYQSSTVCTSEPQVSADITGRPRVAGADKCNSILVNYTDQIFTLEQDACLKILRKWTVIDWCLYHPNDSIKKGYWEWTQVIKINNNVPPTITSSCADRTVEVTGPGCSGRVDLVASATDDCTEAQDLSWYHEVDLYNDGKSQGIEYLHSGPGADAGNVYPLGTHRITFRVKDACGNESYCSYLLTVTDGKKPTPYCLSQIVTTVMPSSKSVQIWAKDFNLNSEDNCTPREKLQYFFLINNVWTPSMTLDCSNVGLNTLRMYVLDEQGNYDYCEVTLELQDPNQVCGGTTPELSGKVTTTDNRVMDQVVMMLDQNNGQVSKQSKTDNKGIYSFKNLIKGANYQVRASYDQDPLNGVSTQDIVLINKHILGIQTFSSPYQYIAADANNSGSITAADISELRKLILGLTSRFQKNESWRFIPQKMNFRNPSNPWPFEESLRHQELGESLTAEDFYAIKVGDISGDASVSGASGMLSRARYKEYKIRTENIQLQEGKIARIPVYSSQDMWVSGLQMSFMLDESFEIIEIEAAAMDISKQHYHVSNSRMKVCYADTRDVFIGKDEVLFYLTGISHRRLNLTEAIGLDEGGLASEIYDDQARAISLGLEFKSSGDVESQDQEIEIFQNEPNPFSESTLIQYFSNKQQKIVVKIFDIRGREIIRRTESAQKGMNYLVLDHAVLELQAGMYRVQFITSQESKFLDIMKI